MNCWNKTFYKLGL